MIIYLAGIIPDKGNETDKSQTVGEKRIMAKARRWQRLLSYYCVADNREQFDVILEAKKAK